MKDRMTDGVGIKPSHLDKRPRIGDSPTDVYIVDETGEIDLLEPRGYSTERAAQTLLRSLGASRRMIAVDDPEVVGEFDHAWQCPETDLIVYACTVEHGTMTAKTILERPTKEVIDMAAAKTKAPEKKAPAKKAPAKKAAAAKTGAPKGARDPATRLCNLTRERHPVKDMVRIHYANRKMWVHKSKAGDNPRVED